MACPSQQTLNHLKAMKNHLLTLALCAAVSSPTVHSQASRDALGSMQGSVMAGNTLAVQNRYGTSLIYFHPNGTFEHHSLKGKVSQGTWRVLADAVCTTALDMAGQSREHCLQIGGRGPGSTWGGSVDSRNGNMSYQLLPGHPGFDALR